MKTVNNLKFNRAIARLSKEEFADIVGPYYVKKVFEMQKDADGNWRKVLDKEGNPIVTNRFCIKLKGPVNPDGTVPPASQGNQCAFVSTNYDPSEEAEFAAFFDENGDAQWLLMNKTKGFTDEAEFIVGM